VYSGEAMNLVPAPVGPVAWSGSQVRRDVASAVVPVQARWDWAVTGPWWDRAGRGWRDCRWRELHQRWMALLLKRRRTSSWKPSAMYDRRCTLMPMDENNFQPLLRMARPRGVSAGVLRLLPAAP